MNTNVTLPPVHICVQSSNVAVRTALKALLRRLEPLELGVDEVGTVELVMAEALNNVVEHAYPEGDAAGPITISCNHAADGLHLMVVDRGRAMPKGQMPDGATVDLDVPFCDTPEGGFGWFLIKDLADEVRYERVEWENRLMFRLAVATQATASC